MFGEDYAYAVARIRVLETGLLNQAAIEQLLACQDEQQCLQILTEKGWGNGDPAAGADSRCGSSGRPDRPGRNAASRSARPS